MAKRSDLKYNFLRRIIVRMDYNGIIDIKETLKDIQELTKRFGFVDMNSGFMNEVEFELNDPIMIENQNMIPLKELNRTETFKFRTSDKNIELEVNKLFTALTINTEVYHRFEQYRDIFIEIVNLIKEKNIYLKPMRIGLRKINNCILKDKSKFKYYFNSKYFNDITNYFNQDGFETSMVVGNYSDTICKDRYFFNYIRNISDATLKMNNQESDVYQVALDIDGYNTDEDWLKEIVDNRERFQFALDEINGLLFLLYIKSLTSEFIEDLKKDNKEWNELLGVKNNGDI